MTFQNDEDWGFFIDLEMDNFYYTYPQQENISQHESRVNFKTVIDIRQNTDYEFDYPAQPTRTTFINVTNKKKQDSNNLIINVVSICIIVYLFNLLKLIFN